MNKKDIELLAEAYETLQPGRRQVIKGIRVLLCGQADYVWDPVLQKFLSINGYYPEYMSQNNREEALKSGLRWVAGDSQHDLARLKGHEDWLKGANEV